MGTQERHASFILFFRLLLDNRNDPRHFSPWLIVQEGLKSHQILKGSFRCWLLSRGAFHFWGKLDILPVAVTRKILDLDLKCNVFRCHQSVVLAFLETWLVGKGPLTDTDSAVHKDYWKLVSVIQTKSKLVVEDRVDRVLKTDRRNIRRLDWITQGRVFGESRVDWYLNDLQVHKSIAAVCTAASLAFELCEFILISEKAQFGSLEVFDVGPSHLADGCFSISAFGLVEKFVTDSPGRFAGGRPFIEDKQNFIVIAHLLYAFSSFSELV